MPALPARRTSNGRKAANGSAAEPAAPVPAPQAVDLSGLEELSHEELIALVEETIGGGITITFSGKANATRIARKVRPRVTRRNKSLSVGPPAAQAANLLIEGDNLQAMATLYRERGKVDLILADPPYNTGNDFRYNDRWEEDPNDPGMGDLVSADDGARHTKWMRFMWPRLQMMRSMLRPGGVLAVCIDMRELFRLGQMLDELFGQNNRLAIINWQKASAPKNDKNHVASTTEYVLVYARDADRTRTEPLPRDADSLTRYKNPDNDPRGRWREHDLTARTPVEKDQYGIQSPLTGTIHYPSGTRSWSHPKRNIKTWLEQWGTSYVAKDIDDGRPPALMVRGGRALPLADPSETRPRTRPGTVPASSKKAATKILRRGQWPFIWFGLDGQGGPRPKKYLEAIRKGFVPMTYWADIDLDDEPLDIGSTSWEWEQSGLSQSGIKELNAIVGSGHGFETVKPLQLFSKIIQIWCPGDGLVMDPFAGSGTTGHAVLELNALAETDRRFILVEQGRPERGDPYASSLTADRLKRTVTGDWASGLRSALGGGFSFQRLDKRVDAQALLQMERDEMVDTVIASHFDANRKRGSNLICVNGTDWRYLVATNSDDEGFFLVWDGLDKNTDFTSSVYEACAIEAERAGLKPFYHIYARLYLYQTENVRFYQIPDRILADFGLDMSSEPFAETSA
jgi:adenine-specific DNA-methyltransferase